LNISENFPELFFENSENVFRFSPDDIASPSCWLFWGGFWSWVVEGEV